MKYKTCTQCKKKKKVSYFYKIKNDNKTNVVYYRPTCKVCCANYKRTKEGLKILGKYRHSPKGRYVYLKAAAKRRNLECTLSKEEYYLLIDKPCFYCEGFFQKDETCGCGLDRINNEFGYIKNNVISCCGICNGIKLNYFSQEETKAAVNAIIEVRKKNSFSLMP